MISMEENLVSSTLSLSLSPQSSPSQSTNQTPSKENLVPQTPPPSVTRLWRPAAQRNLRNQWSMLASYRKDWSSSSSSARSDATALVNSYLSQRYMKDMDLGVLKDMPDIKKKACWKLFKQQGTFIFEGQNPLYNAHLKELFRNKLLSSYKNMVTAVVHMNNTSRSMRIFRKGGSSLLIQFSSVSVDSNDNGDGGGIPAFTFLSISSFEELACECVRMFILELSLKRLLVVELLSLSYEEFHFDPVTWSDELYLGEFMDLSMCGLCSKDIWEPIHPNVRITDSNCSAETAHCQLDHEALQVYLTTWLTEVNIDTYRVEEIFAMVGEEMHVTLS